MTATELLLTPDILWICLRKPISHCLTNRKTWTQATHTETYRYRTTDCHRTASALWIKCKNIKKHKHMYTKLALVHLAKRHVNKWVNNSYAYAHKSVLIILLSNLLTDITKAAKIFYNKLCNSFTSCKLTTPTFRRQRFCNVIDHSIQTGHICNFNWYLYPALSPPHPHPPLSVSISIPLSSTLPSPLCFLLSSLCLPLSFTSRAPSPYLTTLPCPILPLFHPLLSIPILRPLPQTLSSPSVPSVFPPSPFPSFPPLPIPSLLNPYPYRVSCPSPSPYSPICPHSHTLSPSPPFAELS